MNDEFCFCNIIIWYDYHMILYMPNTIDWHKHTIHIKFVCRGLVADCLASSYAERPLGVQQRCVAAVE